MAKIEISERDKVMLENLPKLIKGAKFELNGDVLIPAGQTLSYVGQLIKKMEEALKVLTKVLPIFNPSDDINNSLTTLEKYISKLKDESIHS